MWWMTRSPCFRLKKKEKNIFVIWLACISHFEIFWDKHRNCEPESHHYGERSVFREATAKSPRRLTLLLTLLFVPEETLGSEDTRRRRQPHSERGGQRAQRWASRSGPAASGRFSHLPNLSPSLLQPNVKRTWFTLGLLPGPGRLEGGGRG